MAFVLWWSLSPMNWNGNNSNVWNVNGSDNPGNLNNNNVNNSNGVRPVTSLKSCVLWKSGDGSPEKPYEIEETESGC